MCSWVCTGYLWTEVLFRTPHKKLILSAHDTPQSHHHFIPYTLMDVFYVCEKRLRRALKVLYMLILSTVYLYCIVQDVSIS